MKTEVRKEHGDWIVFVDGNPVIGLDYREEAEKVRNMVDALYELLGTAHDAIRAYGKDPTEDDSFKIAEKALKDIGAI